MTRKPAKDSSIRPRNCFSEEPGERLLPFRHASAVIRGCDSRAKTCTRQPKIPGANIRKGDRFAHGSALKSFTGQALPGILDRKWPSDLILPRRPGPCP